MLKKLAIIVAIIIIFALAFFAYFIFLSGKPKDLWTQQYKSNAPTAFCKSFVNGSTTSASMLANNINYDKCMSLIPISINHCIDIYSASLPSNLNAPTGAYWGSKIGECVGVDFFSRNITHTLPTN